jgi:predicted DNA-binding transcriptional regulator YafY
MSKKESLTRYNIIIKRLRKNPASFDEIYSLLEMESELSGYNLCVSKRTFQRDLEDIRSLYDIEICYDHSRKVYHIVFDDRNEVTERILEAFDTFNAIKITDRLSDHIHFESRPPSGTEHLYGLLHAIQNKFQVEFFYRKFIDEEYSSRKAEPYAMKEHRNRWYLIALDRKDNKMKSFALDRLSSLEITKKHFEYPVDFDVNKHYNNSFGIISPNGEEPQEIELSFDPYQGQYIKTLPLHHSQYILIDNNKELRIKLFMVITFDFIMELLAYGQYVKVLSPNNLSDHMKDNHYKAYRQYK